MTASYTSLKGFNSISDEDLANTIENNLISFFDWGFLDKGGFSSVRVSTTDIRSSNKSTLRKVDDPNYNAGQVWSAFHQNLVWESGLSFSSQPIQISGVYVNGSLKTPVTAGYEHYVDYTNGQVIFVSGIPVTSTVKLEYSYKNILVTKADSVPILREVQFRPYDLSVSDYNSTSSGDWSILGRSKVQFPIIAVEVTPKVEFRPLELGNVCQIAQTDVLFHVFAETQSMSRKLGWMVAAQIDKTIFLFDTNLMAESGVFPLDYKGAKSSNPLTYPDLVKDSVDGGYRFNKLRFTDSVMQGPFKLGSVYHTVIRFETEVLTTS